MNQYKTISDLKDNAKQLLTGKFGYAVIANLIPCLVTYAISFCISILIASIATFSLIMENPAAIQDPNALTGSVELTVITYLVSQIVAVFTGVFSVGTALYFLNIACGRTFALSNLFYGFQHMFKESVSISFVMVVINTVCLLPYNVFYSLYTVSGSSQWLVYTIVALIIGMIVYIPISLSLSQAYYLLLDFPKYSPKEILLLSVRLMKGRKFKLFLIELSFVPLLLLGILSFGIGDLWITPYMNMTMTLYFLDIMKTPKQS